MLSGVSSTLLRVGALVSACVTIGCASAPPVTPVHQSPAPLVPPVVPDTIAVPPAARLVAYFHARGAEVYACAAGPASYAWTLKKPEATLTGNDGIAVGTHGAGPTWTSNDGSAVVGKQIAQADAPDATDAPWLLVGAVTTTGTGIFAGVTYVQRVATSGGTIPVSSCTAENVGAETAAAYTADYYFYRGGTP